jgi:hypothetical protein
MNYSDETADEGAKLQDEIDSQNLWDLESQVEWRWTRCAARRAMPTSTSSRAARSAASRSARCCCRKARPAAARRTDQPSRRRDHGLAGAAPARLSRRGADHHPRPLLPRQCHRLDSRTRPRPRHSLRGQLLRLSRSQGQAPRAGAARTPRQKVLEREREWMGLPKARRPSPRPVSSAYDELVKVNEARTQSPPRRSSFRRASGWATTSSTSRKSVQILWRPAADRQPLSFKLPPGGIVGVIGPNGAGKTTLFRMITGQEKPDSGTIKVGETACNLGYVDQSRDSLDPTRPCGRKSPAATTCCSASAR